MWSEEDEECSEDGTWGNKEDDSLEQSNEDSSIINEAEGESKEEEEGGWSKIGLNGKRKATSRDTNSKNRGITTTIVTVITTRMWK